MIFGKADFIVEGIFFVSKDGEVIFLFLFGVGFSLCFVLGDVEGFSVPSLSVEC